MNIFKKIGEFIMSLFKEKAESIFDVSVIRSSDMENAQGLWNSIIKGDPEWVGGNIRSIKFGKHICNFAATKACQELAVNIEGSERADFIEKIIDSMIEKVFRDKVEDALGYGGIILKPNGNPNTSNAIDYIFPWNFCITEQSTNGDILGIIFFDRITKNDTYYTRLEYHHFIEGKTEDGQEGRFYQIINKAYRSVDESNLGGEVPLDILPEWSGLEPIATADKIDKPLFAYLKMPWNNTIDYTSPEGVSLFANCIEELRDLDIAWSHKGNEVEDSQHITFMDEMALMKRGPKGNEYRRPGMPRFVMGLRMGVDSKNTIDEHVPTLLTTDRIADINSTLSMISTKCGFSQGTFTFNEGQGIKTATEVEANSQDTVQTISDIRKSIKAAIKGLVYALDKYCDLVYGLPSGYVNVLDENVPDENIFYFKDLLASFEQDRDRAYKLLIQDIYSKKKYLMEYEGFSEEEAMQMLAEVEAEKKKEESGTGLFDEE